MAFLAILIGAVFVVAAIRNTHGQLLSALQTDVPGFAVWAAAIFGLAVIGFIPGLKPVSRGLLALVFVVLILKNYQGIFAGFESAWKGAGDQAASANSGGSSSGGSGGGSKSSGATVLDALLNPETFGNNLGAEWGAFLFHDNSGAAGSVNG